MNEIVNKFLFAGDQFMPKIHLRQPKIKVPKVRLLKTYLAFLPDDVGWISDEIL